MFRDNPFASSSRVKKSRMLDPWVVPKRPKTTTNLHHVTSQKSEDFECPKL
jgi:hypothetical protein